MRKQTDPAEQFKQWRREVGLGTRPVDATPANPVPPPQNAEAAADEPTPIADRLPAWVQRVEVWIWMAVAILLIGIGWVLWGDLSPPDQTDPPMVATSTNTGTVTEAPITSPTDSQAADISSPLPAPETTTTTADDSSHQTAPAASETTSPETNPEPQPVETAIDSDSSASLSDAAIRGLLQPPLVVAPSQPVMTSFSLRQAGYQYQYQFSEEAEADALKINNILRMTNYQNLARFLGYTNLDKGPLEQQGHIFRFFSKFLYDSSSTTFEAAKITPVPGGLPYDPAFLLMAHISSADDTQATATFHFPDHWSWPVVTINNLEAEAIGPLNHWSRYESGWVALLVRIPDLAEALRHCRNASLLQTNTPYGNEKGTTIAWDDTCDRQTQLLSGASPLPVGDVLLIRGLRPNQQPANLWASPTLRQTEPIWIFGDLSDHPYGLRPLLTNNDVDQMNLDGPGLVRADSWDVGHQQFVASHIFTSAEYWFRNHMTLQYTIVWEP